MICIILDCQVLPYASLAEAQPEKFKELLGRLVVLKLNGGLGFGVILHTL